MASVFSLFRTILVEVFVDRAMIESNFCGVQFKVQRPTFFQTFWFIRKWSIDLWAKVKLKFTCVARATVNLWRCSSANWKFIVSLRFCELFPILLEEKTFILGLFLKSWTLRLLVCFLVYMYGPGLVGVARRIRLSFVRSSLRRPRTEKAPSGLFTKGFAVGWFSSYSMSRSVYRYFI